MFKANQIRIYPTVKQQIILAINFGCVRWVYNWALDYRIEAHKNKEPIPSKFDMVKMLPDLKKQDKTAWLKGADAQSLSQSIFNLYKAYDGFFDKKLKRGFPKYKNKRSKQSATYTQAVFIVDENHVQIPKLGKVYARGIRNFAGDIKSCVVTKTGTNKYFISILYDNGTELPAPSKTINKDNFIGIDFGLTHLAITSDGIKYENPKPLKEARSKLRKLDQSLSRKKRGSKSHERARLARATAHEKVANVRNDCQHKLTQKLVSENQGIAIESLTVKTMIKNKLFSRGIQDAGWGMLAEKFCYKSEWAGKHFIQIDTFFASSKMCSDCGHKAESMPVNVREWKCSNCNVTHDRDINAAKNIKAEGIRLLKEKLNQVGNLKGGDENKSGKKPRTSAKLLAQY